MGLFVLLAAAGLVFAWWTGRLKSLTQDDIVAALLFLLGFELLMKGNLLPGAALMASSLLWAAWRRKPRAAAPPPPMPADEARRLLGLPADAGLAEIREAHRRLIARVHPDSGGSAELATRVNAARDALVAEMNRRPPRAS